MRVVFLTHNYPRWNGDLAGGFLSLLAGALTEQGVGVTVVAPSDRGTGGVSSDGAVVVKRPRYGPAEEETLGYGGMITAAVRSPSGVRRLVALGRALRNAAREAMNEADVLHAHWWVPAGLSAPPNAPMVLTSHGTDAALLRRSAAARLLARPVYRRARVVTAVSAELARWISDGTGIPQDSVRVQPMPVDVGAFHRHAGGGGAIVVARLTAQKRVWLAIDAVAQARAHGDALRLTIVGDGPARAALERHASDRGVANLVTFRGAVATHDVAALLAVADVMLATSAGEGFGLAAAEALMAGVPVVACSDGGGLLDVVRDGSGGRIVPPDPAAVAAAALALVRDAAGDGGAREAGREWRERLEAANVARVCAGWYAEALGG